MGSCLGKLFGKREGQGYERASRNAEDAFDDDSDTDAPLLETVEEESRADRSSASGAAVPRLQIDSAEYKDEDSGGEEEGEATDGAANFNVGSVEPDQLDALAEAALRANVESLMPDLDTPVPFNTPAEGNLLDL